MLRPLENINIFGLMGCLKMQEPQFCTSQYTTVTCGKL